MGVCGQRHVLATLSLGKRPSTHCTGGWVGPRAGLYRRLGGPQGRSVQEAVWAPGPVFTGGWVGPRDGPYRRLGGPQGRSVQEAGWASGTVCTGGWVGPRVGLDVCEKSRPYRDSITGASSPYPVAIPTELTRPLLWGVAVIFLSSITALTANGIFFGLRHYWIQRAT
jgi:hypothetical protein